MDNSENADTIESNDCKRPMDDSLDSDEKEEKIPRVGCNSSSESHSGTDEESEEGVSLQDKLEYVERNRKNIPALLFAAGYADVDVCRKLVVDDGANVNETDQKGNDVYHYAAMNRNKCDLELLEFFATHGAEMKRFNNDHADAVRLALHWKNFRFAKELFDKYESDKSFLLHCIDLAPESIKFAYEQDPSVVKVKGKDEFDLQILNEMAWFHDFETFKWIIEEAKKFGADLSTNKERQLSILRGVGHVGVRKDDCEAIANFLCSSYAKDWTEEDWTNLLTEFLPKGQSQFVQLLLNHGTDLNVHILNGQKSLFQYCVEMNRLEATKFVFKRNKEKIINMPTLISVAKTNNLEMIEWLLQLNPALELDKHFLYAALKNAKYGRVIIDNFAEELHAHINTVNEEGKTPLHMAVDNFDLPVFKTLLEMGADLSVKYKDWNMLIYCLEKMFLPGAKVVYAKDAKQLEGSNKRDILALDLGKSNMEIEVWLHSVGCTR